jgi:membrane-associated phospholipid phosphatase
MLVEDKTKATSLIIHPLIRLARQPFLVHFRLVDYLTAGYLLLVALLILPFQHRIEHGLLFSGINLLAVFFLTCFVHYCGERPRSRVLRLLHSCYPMILYTFMFVQVSRIITIFFPFWLEDYLIRLDFALFDVYPPVWVQQYFHPWLSEFMAFSYWSYYIIFPLCAFLLYRNRDKQLFHSYVLCLSLTFYACYLSYPFLTARGPHHTLSNLYMYREFAGFFDAIVRNMQSGVAISGAAFPSSHVAATWVVWIYMYKYKKMYGWIVLPLVIALSLSVVYMQYHYAVDSIAGLFWFLLTYRLTLYLENYITPAGVPPAIRLKSSNNNKKS